MLPLSTIRFELDANNETFHNDVSQIVTQLCPKDHLGRPLDPSLLKHIANTAFAYLNASTPLGNQLFSPKVAHLSQNAFLDNECCIYELLIPLGKGSNRTVMQGIQIKKISSEENKTKIEISSIAVIRYVCSKKMAKELNTIAQKFDSPYLHKYSKYSFETLSSLFAVTEKIRCNLAPLSTRKCGLTTQQVWGAVEGAARGLQELHRLGFVHRDIKPENMVITYDGVGQLIDFDNAHDKLLGSPTYSPPEIAREYPDFLTDDGGDIWDAENQTSFGDMWSFGITCYQIGYGNINSPQFLLLDTNEELYNFHRSLSPAVELPLFSDWKAETASEMKMQGMVQKLMSIVPEERGNAADVIATIQEIQSLL